MRLIDADALIEKLEAWKKEAERRNANINYTFASAIIAQVNAEPTVEERKWIPCSERLPEINHFMYDVEPFSDEVLVAIKNEYGADAIDIAALEQRHGWRLEMDDGFRWRVIAWMPLPEPYEERREE